MKKIILLFFVCFFVSLGFGREVFFADENSFNIEIDCKKNGDEYDLDLTVENICDNDVYVLKAFLFYGGNFSNGRVTIINDSFRLKTDTGCYCYDGIIGDPYIPLNMKSLPKKDLEKICYLIKKGEKKTVTIKALQKFYILEEGDSIKEIMYTGPLGESKYFPVRCKIINKIPSGVF